MVITSKEIQYNLGFTQGWISKHLRHLAKDYVINRYSQYEVEDVIKYANNYRSDSKNTKNKELSEHMMKQLKDYLEKEVS
jgi:DNA-binding HxlR family transcriptional regulator